LARLRGLPEDHPYCREELSAIEAAYHEQTETTRGTGRLGALKEMFLVRKNVYRLFLLTTAQLLASWSGGGAITLYAPDLFGMLGVSGQEQKLFTSAILGVVKLVAAIVCALFLVDVIGRRRSLISGIVLQTISLMYIGAFLTTVPIATDPEFTPNASQKRAGTAAIISMYTASVGWALGWNSAQYLLTAELFPARIRAVCTSFVMAVHFITGYGGSRAVPNMLLQHNGLTPPGTFWFYGAVSLISGLWVFFCLPEAAGRSLETIDRLFELPWYKLRLYGKKVADENDHLATLQTARKENMVNTAHKETT